MFFRTCMLYTHLLLFNFQRPLRCRSHSDPTIITQRFRLVNTFFETFLSFFKVFSWCALFCDSLYILPHLNAFVNPLFCIFGVFLSLFAKRSKKAALTGISAPKITQNSRLFRHLQVGFPFCANLPLYAHARVYINVSAAIRYSVFGCAV